MRPVTEVFVEREFGEKTTVSALVGAIWRVHHEFSLDMGLRIARADEQAIGEVRLGFTWAIPVWGAK